MAVIAGHGAATGVARRPRGRAAARVGLATCLASLLLTAIALGTSSGPAAATRLGNCSTAGTPRTFPFQPDDPVVFSTNFRGTTVPTGWWDPPYATPFNQYTVHAPGNVRFSGAEMQLTNSPDADGTQQDMGIAGESPVLATSGKMANGASGDSLVMAWCARVTSDDHIDTDFELGQTDSRPWPPEIDLAEGAGNALTVILHWTCDASISGCPSRDGYFNGRVAPKGSSSPWPPRGVRVGSQYFCDKITNASGQQVTNDPSDGHYDYNCRAQIPLPLPKGVSVTAWNEFGASINPSDHVLSVWVDGQRPVTVNAKTCGSHLLYDDDGVMPIGQVENGGASEPCLQVGGNWQWDVQQTEWMGRKTVPGLTKGQFDTADVAWWGDYAFAPAPATAR